MNKRGLLIIYLTPHKAEGLGHIIGAAVRSSSLRGPNDDELHSRDKTRGEMGIRKLVYNTHDNSIYRKQLLPQNLQEPHHLATVIADFFPLSIFSLASGPWARYFTNSELPAHCLHIILIMNVPKRGMRGPTLLKAWSRSLHNKLAPGD